MNRLLLVFFTAALVSCSQAPQETSKAKQRVECPPLPELPKTPTYASQLTLINLYGLCATLRAND